jgi:hypothetical protein
MKYNITFTLTGPSGRIIEAENSTNPVESESFSTLLLALAEKLPNFGFGVEIIGIKIDVSHIDNVNLERTPMRDPKYQHHIGSNPEKISRPGIDEPMDASE